MDFAEGSSVKYVNFIICNLKLKIQNKFYHKLQKLCFLSVCKNDLRKFMHGRQIWFGCFGTTLFQLDLYLKISLFSDEFRYYNIHLKQKKIFNEIYLIYYGNTIHISRWQMLSAFKLYIWFIFEFYRLKETDLWDFSYIYIWIFFIIINNNLFCNLLWLFYTNKSLKLIKFSFEIMSFCKLI